MPQLELESSPPGTSYEEGSIFPLDDVDPFRVGSDLSNELHLEHGSVAPQQAWITREGQGGFVIVNKGPAGTTCINGTAVSHAPLEDSHLVRLGDFEFCFTIQSSPKVDPLHKWLDRADPAHGSLTDDQIVQAAELCCIMTSDLLLRHPKVREQIHAWYGAYRQHPLHSLLPVALPFLMDLGAMIWRGTPPRTANLPDIREGGAFDDDQFRFVTLYQGRLMRDLYRQRDVDFILKRTPAARNDPVAVTEIVARFCCHIFTWAVTTWCKATGEGLPADRGLRILNGPEPVRRFLTQLSQIVQNQRGQALRETISRVDRFQLGARAFLPYALKDSLKSHLVDECMRSRPLDEDDYERDPVELLKETPDVPTMYSGDYLSVRCVRETTRLEDLPEVIPQDLALARTGKDGRRLLVEKLTKEGLLRWDRQRHDSEDRRKRYLVCLIADTGSRADVRDDRGGYFWGRSGGRSKPVADRGATPAVHSQRLIFELLRDIAVYVDDPDLDLRLHLFLDPDVKRGEPCIEATFTLESLHERFGSGNFDDMVELEHACSGYFFSRRGNEGLQGNDYQTLLRQAVEGGGHDLLLVVFLARIERLFHMLPAESIHPRHNDDAKHVVKMVQPAVEPACVKVASSTSLLEAQVNGEFHFCSDVDFRYGILDTLLGPRRPKDRFTQAPQRAGTGGGR